MTNKTNLCPKCNPERVEVLGWIPGTLFYVCTVCKKRLKLVVNENGEKRITEFTPDEIKAPHFPG
jgi:hypothetical protein